MVTINLSAFSTCVARDCWQVRQWLTDDLRRLEGVVRASGQAAASEAVRQLAADGVAECFKLAKCALSQCIQGLESAMEAMRVRANTTAILATVRSLAHLHVTARHQGTSLSTLSTPDAPTGSSSQRLVTWSCCGAAGRATCPAASLWSPPHAPPSRRRLSQAGSIVPFH